MLPNFAFDLLFTRCNNAIANSHAYPAGNTLESHHRYLIFI